MLMLRFLYRLDKQLIEEAERMLSSSAVVLSADEDSSLEATESAATENKGEKHGIDSLMNIKLLSDCVVQ